MTTRWTFINRERLCILRSYAHTPRMEPVPALVTLYHNSFRVDSCTKTIMLLLSLSLTCLAFVIGLKGRELFSLTSSTPIWTVGNLSLVGLPLNFRFKGIPNTLTIPVILTALGKVAGPQTFIYLKSTNHFGNFLYSQSFNLS